MFYCYINSGITKIIKKESVELIFVYRQRGSDKTQAKINDTMPHTWKYGVYAQK